MVGTPVVVATVVVITRVSPIVVSPIVIATIVVATIVIATIVIATIVISNIAITTAPTVVVAAATKNIEESVKQETNKIQPIHAPAGVYLVLPPSFLSTCLFFLPQEHEPPLGRKNLCCPPSWASRFFLLPQPEL